MVVYSTASRSLAFSMLHKAETVADVTGVRFTVAMVGRPQMSTRPNTPDALTLFPRRELHASRRSIVRGGSASPRPPQHRRDSRAR